MSRRSHLFRRCENVFSCLRSLVYSKLGLPCHFTILYRNCSQFKRKHFRFLVCTLSLRISVVRMSSGRNQVTFSTWKSTVSLFLDTKGNLIIFAKQFSSWQPVFFWQFVASETVSENWYNSCKKTMIGKQNKAMTWCYSRCMPLDCLLCFLR